MNSLFFEKENDWFTVVEKTLNGMIGSKNRSEKKKCSRKTSERDSLCFVAAKVARSLKFWSQNYSGEDSQKGQE